MSCLTRYHEGLGTQSGVWRALLDIEEGIWVSTGRSTDLLVDQDTLEHANTTFLGHMVNATGRYPCVTKVKAIMEEEYLIRRTLL